MSRSCKICRKNKTQPLFACGYLPEEQRNPNQIYHFALYNDPKFHVKECPVYYYNEYSNLYTLYNLMKDSALDLTTQPFYRRFVYLTFKQYMGLRKEKELKDMEK